MLITDSYHIPLYYVVKYLVANGNCTEQAGQLFAVFKEVKFKMNNVNTDE